MYKWNFAMAALLAAPLLLHVGGATAAPTHTASKGTTTLQRLTPHYPLDRDCSPLTSLFASWDDVDGTERRRPHSGVDGGRLGEPVLAPAPGEIIAVWRANWGWGPEGALLIRHSKEALGLTGGPDYYYSEFDHLRYSEIRTIPVGKRVKRGEPLARVDRPGGDPQYLPEVHWEVWSIDDDEATEWAVNAHGARYWINPTGRLVDPLYMMSLNQTARRDHSVAIPPFDATQDYRGFRGFTYILPCPPQKARVQTR